MTSDHIDLRPRDFGQILFLFGKFAPFPCKEGYGRVVKPKEEPEERGRPKKGTDEFSRRVIRFIADHPRCTINEIREALPVRGKMMSPTTIRSATSFLESHGEIFIAKNRHGEVGLRFVVNGDYR